MVLLNGKTVAESEIDPARHRFIGRFRPATNWMADARTDVLCSCGDILRYVHQLQEHYNRGCCDMNQYVDIGQQGDAHAA